MPHHKQPKQQATSEQGDYPLPRDTRRIADAHANQCLNYGLRIDRLLLRNSQTWELTQQSKERFTQLVGGKKVLEFTQTDLLCLIMAYRDRWKALLSDYRRDGYTVCRFKLRADSRVIVGLGAESVLETSIRLHRVFGFPVIPGSALKGLARSYAAWMGAEGDADFAAIFGKAPPDAAAGKVIFFDAIPDSPSNLRLELDVMNPHYVPYYQGPEPPADYHDPIPIPFLTIGRDSEFLFAVASRDRHLAPKAADWLKKGLLQLGIGAKTTTGYGFWTDKTPGAGGSR